MLELMVGFVSELGRIDPYSWLSLGLGFVLSAVGALALYGELQVILTGTDPPLPDGPDAVQTAQRVRGWLAMVVLLVAGLALLYFFSVDIYSCLVGQEQRVSC